MFAKSLKWLASQSDECEASLFFSEVALEYGSMAYYTQQAASTQNMNAYDERIYVLILYMYKYVYVLYTYTRWVYQAVQAVVRVIIARSLQVIFSINKHRLGNVFAK